MTMKMMTMVIVASGKITEKLVSTQLKSRLCGPNGCYTNGE